MLANVWYLCVLLSPLHLLVSVTRCRWLLMDHWVGGSVFRNDASWSDTSSSYLCLCLCLCLWTVKYAHQSKLIVRYGAHPKHPKCLHTFPKMRSSRAFLPVTNQRRTKISNMKHKIISFCTISMLNSLYIFMKKIYILWSNQMLCDRWEMSVCVSASASEWLRCQNVFPLLKGVAILFRDMIIKKT